jgi:hypothetical protein
MRFYFICFHLFLLLLFFFMGWGMGSWRKRLSVEPQLTLNSLLSYFIAVLDFDAKGV